jgi:ankyrin repeat protein
MLLVEHGATIDVKDKRGMTPLMNAAFYKHFDVVEYLLANGANVNEVGPEKKTALHFAVTNSGRGTEYDMKRCVEHLLEAGANVHMSDAYDKFPFDYAASDKELMHMLQYPPPKK